MAKFNKFLIVLIAIMAIGAAYLSYRLFEKRNDFRARAADLAETVKVAAGHLDERSNTRVKKHITFSRRAEGQPESGTLSWMAYENPAEFNENLDRVEVLAKDINAQRNYLAEQLRSVALELGIPVEELSVDDLTNAADSEIYKDAAQKVLRLATAYAERNDALIQTVISTANIIEVPIDEAELREREVSTDEDGNEILGSFMHEQRLDQYATAINDLNTRCFNYANTLAKAITQISAFNWNTTADKIRDRDNYSPALTTLANDFDRINDFLVERKTLIARVDSLEEELADVNSQLEEVIEERSKLRAEVERLEAIEQKYIKLTGQPSDTGTGKGPAQLNPNIEGEVLSVNKEWNFIILSLGAGEVFKNAELLVSRQGQFIARVVVTSVSDNISVAEILPGTQQAPVQKNDRVLAPAATKSQAKAE